MLNPLLMSAEELIRWYQPANEIEQHLLNKLDEAISAEEESSVEYENAIGELEDEIENLKEKINELSTTTN